MTAKDCLYNIPDETRFVNIFFRANGIKWREIFGRQRYSENVRQVTAPAVELQRPTRPLIRLLNRNKPFPTELFIIGSKHCKSFVGSDARIGLLPLTKLYLPIPQGCCGLMTSICPYKQNQGQYRIILSADTASEVRQMPSQKRR